MVVSQNGRLDGHSKRLLVRVKRLPEGSAQLFGNCQKCLPVLPNAIRLDRSRSFILIPAWGQMMKNFLLPLLFGSTLVLTWWSSSTRGDFITVNPIADNSIYSESNNSNAKGSLYVGQIGLNGGNALRRALLRFDVSTIPTGAIINTVTLGLTQTRHGGLSVAENLELHRVSAAWGEGTSNGIGQGSAPTPGDATWNFRQFNTLSWTSPGGDFAATSGTTTIGIVDTAYTFATQPGLVADVQSWVNNPSSNFGWLLKTATELNADGARQFGSREIGAAPSLVINFTAVPEPSSIVFLGAISLVAFGLIAFRRCKVAEPVFRVGHHLSHIKS